MATLQVAGAFSLRTGFGPSHIKGPQERGGPGAGGYIGGTGSVSDCKARAENRLNGPAEKTLPPNFKREKLRHLLSVGEKKTRWIYSRDPDFIFTK